MDGLRSSFPTYDESLDAAFSRLNVSPFTHFSGADHGNGPQHPYTSSTAQTFSVSRDSLNLSNGVFGGAEDFWVGGDSETGGHGSVGAGSNWSQEPLNNLSVSEVRGTIAVLAKDQYGCRFFQSAMEQHPQYIDMIFDEVFEHVSSLMLDPYGTYVVQNLVEACSDEQRTQILLLLTKNPFLFITLCLHNRGTRCVQKLMKKLCSREQVSLFMTALSCGAADLSMNINGQHIVEYCLKNFSDEHKRCFLSAVIDNCIGIAKDKVGCCVLQQCIDYCYGETKARLISEIVGEAFHLAQDRYGNYVLQHLLKLKTPQITSHILSQLQGNYMFLSCGKYGSNVVEKCLLESGDDQVAKIIRELCLSPNISMLLMHPFGNYVYQTALAVSTGISHSFLLNLLQQHTPALLSSHYGKRVLSWRERSLRRM